MENLLNWWSNLDDWWKITFKQYIFNINREQSKNMSNDLSNEDLNKILQINSINLWGDIDSIEPLRKLKNLKKIFCWEESVHITTLEPLTNLKSLKTLNIIGTQVSDLSPLKNCLNLRELYCFKTKITSIAPIMHLRKIELLWIGFNIPKNEVVKFQKLHPNCKINPKN